jgi:hypothetical protein
VILFKWLRFQLLFRKCPVRLTAARHIIVTEVHFFVQSLQINSLTVPQIRLLSLSFKSLPIHYLFLFRHSKLRWISYEQRRLTEHNESVAVTSSELKWVSSLHGTRIGVSWLERWHDPYSGGILFESRTRL